ncbi:class I SAM-dependent methyltransferase [Asaia siamensis]|uniref:Methyltransferase n=1 Tax=Asaia siamensis TaxID=110479 RepID=A0ABQ1M0E4_9PROT|nr:class I SAM-dependent methyltransferase [Asaia siamensis]GBR02864.1 putative methyltransferase [Asaia siamensis NRIC 0323]GGC30690.1 methyltransferase [Asaia siamensis]
MIPRSTLALILTGLALTPVAAVHAQSASDAATALPSAAILASPARPDADRAKDAQRKPFDLLALTPLPKGAAVADLMPGSGYFTRLLSLELGASGHVYAVIPAEMVARHPQIPQMAQAIAANPAFGNVSVVVTPIVDFKVAQPLDLVWTSQNYHDVYGGMGPATALHMDQAIYQALKPGGIFMVIDHVALAGTGTTAPTTLHRIDPDLIVKQVESAGFRLVTSSPALRNPDDTHTLPVFDKSIRGRTDQVVLKFQKPLKQDHDN